MSRNQRPLGKNGRLYQGQLPPIQTAVPMLGSTPTEEQQQQIRQVQFTQACIQIADRIYIPWVSKYLESLAPGTKPDGQHMEWMAQASWDAAPYVFFVSGVATRNSKEESTEQPKQESGSVIVEG